MDQEILPAFLDASKKFDQELHLLVESQNALLNDVRTHLEDKKLSLIKFLMNFLAGDFSSPEFHNTFVVSYSSDMNFVVQSFELFL